VRNRLGLVVALLGFGALVLWAAWVADDAFITVRVADNALRGFGLRWNIMERVQAYTHPLWLGIVLASYALTHEVLWTISLVSTTITVVAVALLAHRVLRIGVGRAIVFVLLLTCSKSVLSYGTSGLENPLSLLLLAGLVLSPSGRPRTAVLLAALLALCREDLLLIAAPIVLAHLRPLAWPARLRVLALGGLPLYGWEIFSLIYYGALVPNTALAKLGSGIAHGVLLRQGLRYWASLAVWDPVGAMLLTCGVGAGLIDSRRRGLALGLVAYGLYLLWIGGDFMCGRFFAIPIVLATLMFCEAEWPARVRLWIALFPLFLLAAPDRTPLHWLRGAELPWFSDGIIDERVFYVAHTGLFHPLRARDLRWHLYARHGREIAHRGVAVESAIGMFGYYAGPTVHIIDDMALADPLLARLPMTDPSQFRPGHFRRALPEGYEATVYQGVNEITDPDLARYWDSIELITRGPIWSRARWRAIAASLDGELAPLRAAYLARQAAERDKMPR
jgi:arabinofuranosyltransferase